METIRVMVVGAPKSGKSWLISRLINKKLPQEYRPTVEQCSSTTHTAEDKEGKQYLLKFLEIGSINDMLYRLYVTMCDVILLTVDCSDPCSTQNAIQIIGSLRNSAVSADRLKIITITTKFEASNDCITLPQLGDVYPNIITSARLNMCMNEVKKQIVTSTMRRKSSITGSFKERIRDRKEKRETTRQNLKVNKKFERLRAHSDSEIAASLESQSLVSPPASPDSVSENSSFRCPTIYRGAKLSPAESIGLFEKANKEHLKEFDEYMILPKSLQGQRKFFHLCHVIEVPPIVMEKDEPSGLGVRLQGFASTFKSKIEYAWQDVKVYASNFNEKR